METIREQLLSMLLEHFDLISQFGGKTYKDAFETLYKAYRPMLDSIEETYQAQEDKEGFLLELSESFARGAKEHYDNQEKRGRKKLEILDYNMLVTAFIIPCLMEYRRDSTELLSEKIIEAWNKTFTKYTIRKGSFAEIDGSFKRKLCYITTAVCENLNKEDDCYELNTLRHFRDSYMLHSAEGEQLVSEYYETAPALVMRLNLLKEADKVYQEIYETYIRPCISYIEANQLPKCEETYKKMVAYLKENY